MNRIPSRFPACLSALLLTLLAACASAPSPAPAPAPSLEQEPPIVFVHGNGDTAALWMTTIWRFETNGWPRERLFAVDLPYPSARADDTKPQAGRSSAAENSEHLAAEVKRVLGLTHAPKVVLVGNSRGGNAIRYYLRDLGGASVVSHAILGGATNHGVVKSAEFLPNSEFNGDSAFMRALNSPQGPNGLEVTPGVAFLTVRSDHNDKFAQPEGRWLGKPQMQTHIGFDAPALKGAKNVVLDGVDHRETSYGPRAFAEDWQFLTGAPPRTVGVAPEKRIVLDGRITGYLGNDPTNLPLPGATLEIYETWSQTGERVGAPVHTKKVGEDGEWGPFEAKAGMHYEFVITAPGYAITHIYRSPFPRSTSVLHMRPVRIAEADRDASSVVTMTRPRGYFGLGRDTMSLDGKPPAGITAGVPGLSVAKVKLHEDAPRSVVAEFNGERIVARSWPLKENHAVLAEFHY